MLDGDLFGELAFQGLRLDNQLSLLIFGRLASVLHEFIHCRHVLHKQLRTRLPHVREETRERLRVLTSRGKLIVDFLDASLFDLFTPGQLLKCDPLRKQFVEVKVIISQEFETTRLICLELIYVKYYLELNHLALIE